jgi:hypothetical protein
LPALAATATDGGSATGNAIGADANGNPRPALATQEWIRSGSGLGQSQAVFLERLTQLAGELERAPTAAKDGAVEYLATHPAGAGAAYERGWLVQSCKNAAAELRQLLALLGAVVLLVVLLPGCASTFEVQCAGAGGIDCSLVDLPICTSKFGDSAPHAFCTLECDVDEDCDGGIGRCVSWRFPAGTKRVCVSPGWAALVSK